MKEKFAGKKLLAGLMIAGTLSVSGTAFASVKINEARNVSILGDILRVILRDERRPEPPRHEPPRPAPAPRPEPPRPSPRREPEPPRGRNERAPEPRPRPEDRRPEPRQPDRGRR